jgi:hypothetical protein
LEPLAPFPLASPTRSGAREAVQVMDLAPRVVLCAKRPHMATSLHRLAADRFAAIVSVVAMVVTATAVGNPQRAFDAADDATAHPAYNTAHSAADRSEHTMAHVSTFVRSFVCTYSDALSLRRDGHSKKGEDAGSHHKIHFHGRVSLCEKGIPRHVIEYVLRPQAFRPAPMVLIGGSRQECAYRAQIANLKSDCPGIVGHCRQRRRSTSRLADGGPPRGRQSTSCCVRPCQIGAQLRNSC